MSGLWVSLTLAPAPPSPLVLAGGFVAHVESTCLLDDDGTPQDFSYCISFNKDLLTCWDAEKGAMVPLEFGVLHPLAANFADYLNKQEILLQRLSAGRQDCALRTQPFWGSLTQRIRKERGACCVCGGAFRKHSWERGGQGGSLQARGLRSGQKVCGPGGKKREVGPKADIGGGQGWSRNKGGEVMFPACSLH